MLSTHSQRQPRRRLRPRHSGRPRWRRGQRRRLDRTSDKPV